MEAAALEQVAQVVPAWVGEVVVVVEQVAQVVPLEVEVVGKLRPLWPAGELPQTV